VWEEYGAGAAAKSGFPPNMAMAACGWAVLIATWVIGTRMTSGLNDNRPRVKPTEATGPSMLDTEEALAQ
jgi:hypothetical protein